MNASAVTGAFAAAGFAAATLLYSVLGKNSTAKHDDREPSRRTRKARGRGFVCPGLLNLGNTCFVNAVLQALASVHSFVEWLAAVKEGKLDEKNLGTAVYDTINVLTGEGEECSLYSPSPVIEAIQGHGWIFEGQQQDAHELFHVLTMTIEEEKGEMQSVLSLNDLQLVQDEEQQVVDHAYTRSQGPMRSLSEEKHSLPFHGLLASEMICKDCGYKAPLRYDAFDSVSLSLPQYPVITRNVLTLHDLLMRFVQAEVLKDIECASCSKDSEAKGASAAKTFIRRQTLGKIPKCLCIHVQRTYWNTMGLPFKNDTYFSFPEHLDLSLYTYNTPVKQERTNKLSTNLLRGGSIGTCLPTQLNMNSGLRGDMLAAVRGNWFPVGHTASSSVFESKAEKSCRSTRMKLMAVISHMGSYDSGHFITYRRLVNRDDSELSSDTWVHISDDEVTSASLTEVLKCRAYMLFYE